MCAAQQPVGPGAADGAQALAVTYAARRSSTLPMAHDTAYFDAGVPALREIPPCLERLKALRCLVAVVQHGSTLRASEAIHLSQPAVTRSIIDLERAFEMPLFERGGRGMSPTPPGAAAAKRAAQLFQHLAKGAAEALALSPVKGQRSPAPERFASSVSSSSLAAMLAVAASGSESRAAHMLGASQPSIHRSLRVVEQLCGVALLQKSARGTRLTEGGEAMLLRVKLAVAEARALEAELASWRGQIRGRVIVGALPLAATQLLVRAVDEVLGTHPEAGPRGAPARLRGGRALRAGGEKRRIAPSKRIERASTLDDLHRWRWVLPLRPGWVIAVTHSSTRSAGHEGFVQGDDSGRGRLRVGRGRAGQRRGGSGGCRLSEPADQADRRVRRRRHSRRAGACARRGSRPEAGPTDDRREPRRRRRNDFGCDHRQGAA